MRSALSLLLAASLSCGGNALAFRDPVTFNAEGQADVVRAAGKWSEILTVPVYFGPSADWRIEAIAPVGGYAGYCDRGRKLILIRPDARSVYVVALHEMGHALGLDHTARGVMHPHEGGTEFSEEDTAECRRVGRCGEAP